MNYSKLIVALLVWCSGSLCARTMMSDSELLHAFLREEMTVWQAYVDGLPDEVTDHDLLYEYGFCGYIVDKDKEAAKPYIRRFKAHVQSASLPEGHKEMYLSAVYVYELRVHESFHPVKALSLAREAVKKAPSDPLTLTYCGTSLFYAPSPFGNKKEALQLFETADELFRAPQWVDCWWRAAAMMYIAQCYDKLGNKEEAIRRAESALTEYPDYLFLRRYLSESREGIE